MTDQPDPLVRLERPQHSVSRSLIDPDALWILRQLRQEGFRAFLVGGAVRDILLGREPKDFDIGTDARPSQLRRLFRNSRLIGRRFRIAHVFFRRKGEPEKIIEVSTFRGMAKVEEDHDLAPEDVDLTGSSFGTPEEDAFRRDFTVNALFYDSSDFSVHDYVGGLADLEARLIRLIGDPGARFTEDPVRMLRAVEFAVRLEFAIEETTHAGIAANAGRIVEASPARLREEFRQMQARGIMGDALERAHALGMFLPLFPELAARKEGFDLLRRLDSRAAAGEPPAEHVYLAALCLPAMLSRIPFSPDAALEDVSEALHDVVGGVCARYQISAHIRHLAREILLGCYRIAKGKAYRTKGKYAKKADFTAAFELFRHWSDAAGALGDVVDYWRDYLSQRDRSREGNRENREGGRRRPRRRRRTGRAGRAPESAPVA